MGAEDPRPELRLGRRLPGQSAHRADHRALRRGREGRPRSRAAPLGLQRAHGAVASDLLRRRREDPLARGPGRALRRRAGPAEAVSDGRRARDRQRRRPRAPSRKETRRWSASSYARLGRLLRDKHGSRLKVFWGPGEKDLADEVVKGIGSGAAAIAETRCIRDLARELASCRVVVTNCAGPKHVAVALGVPTVTIHGSSDPAAWNPPHPKHPFVRLEELPCIGCRSNDCPYNLECMTQLPAERVLPLVERLLAGAEAKA
ncbi:MAG: glycosyltransferase family 9 protein [Elusimicrobiota bacterium]|nr:MAG: glycosyltransferase family 9 protein [Elusimicrobiota bacterium]